MDNESMKAYLRRSDKPGVTGYPHLKLFSQGIPPVGATGGRPVRVQSRQARQSWVREKKGRASLSPLQRAP